MQKLLHRITRQVRDVRDLPWDGVLDRLPWAAGMLVVASGLILGVLAMPSIFVGIDQTGILNIFVAAHVLVNLAYVFLSWFCTATLAWLLSNVLDVHKAGGAPGRLFVLAGQSLARIATYAGRAVVTVLLVSVFSWVSGFLQNSSAAPVTSLVKQVAKVQMGTLLVALIVIVAYEAVRVALEQTAEMPSLLKWSASALIPLLGWWGAQQAIDFTTATARAAALLAPNGAGGLSAEDFASEVARQGWGTPMGAALGAILVALSLNALRLRVVARGDGAQVVVPSDAGDKAGRHEGGTTTRQN